MPTDNSNLMTFWDHLEVFRKLLFRILAIVMAVAVITFCLKEPLFKIILAPSHSDFALYNLIEYVASAMGLDASAISNFNIELFSATLTAQFMIHLKIAFYAGLIVAMPYTDIIRIRIRIPTAKPIAVREQICTGAAV